VTQHEQHQRVAHHDVRIGSERSFGIVFGVVFTVIGAWPLLRGDEPRFWSLALAIAFLAAALLRPQVLGPLNWLWFKFGILLSKVTTPIVMGLLFVVAVVPTALVMRLRRKDLLNLRFQPEARSYWIVRDPPGPTPDTMKNQF
jgi:predicted membrane metal-binding protein